MFFYLFFILTSTSHLLCARCPQKKICPIKGMGLVGCRTYQNIHFDSDNDVFCYFIYTLIMIHLESEHLSRGTRFFNVSRSNHPWASSTILLTTASPPPLAIRFVHWWNYWWSSIRNTATVWHFYNRYRHTVNHKYAAMFHHIVTFFFLMRFVYNNDTPIHLKSLN